MFKLNIESTKDITELHINFADGTSTVVENGKSGISNEHQAKQADNVDSLTSGDYNLSDYDTPQVSSVPVEKPSIPDVNDVKVSQELQNLNI